jgi:hypothetical protein
MAAVTDRASSFSRGANIGFSHAPIRPGPFDAAKINAELGRDSTRDRRSFHARFV